MPCSSCNRCRAARLMAAVVRKCQPSTDNRCGGRHRGLHRTESGGFMTDGLIAPLSPPEEIALRRIALGSLAALDPKVASRLVALALVQRTNTGLHLTPLGQFRFNG